MRRITLYEYEYIVESRIICTLGFINADKCVDLFPAEQVGTCAWVNAWLYFNQQNMRQKLHVLMYLKMYFLVNVEV